MKKNIKKDHYQFGLKFHAHDSVNDTRITSTKKINEI
jgi:hypothetical protein